MPLVIHKSEQKCQLRPLNIFFCFSDNQMEEGNIQEELEPVSDKKADKSPKKVQAKTAETPETIKETPEKSPEKSPDKLPEKSTEESPLSSIGDDNLLNQGEFKVLRL